MTTTYRLRAATAMEVLETSSNPGGLLEVVRLLRARTMSALEATQDCLKRIASVNEELGCFVTVGADQAEAAAKSMMQTTSRVDERPLLWGIPISIKDLAATKGLRTTFSSMAFSDHVPAQDSPVVRVIRDAGAIIIGKTNTPEFGILPVTESKLNGICRNPWAPELTAGGSSGGAAAAVAAGITPAAHGSDGAGSLRIPASCCGVFAVLPGPKRLPPNPRVTLGRGSQDGFVSRTVSDALCWLAGLRVLSQDELAAAVATDPPSAAAGTISITCAPPFDCPVSPDCATAAKKAADLLTGLGLRVEERTLDWSCDALFTDMMLLRSTIPVSYGDPDAELLDRTTRQSMRFATEVPALGLHRALVRLRGYVQRIDRLIGENEILLTPTLAQPTVPHQWITAPDDPAEVFRRAMMFTPFTAFVNLLGLCAVSVPLHWTAASIPVGVQLVSRPNNLATVLNLSARLEELAPWAHRRPVVFAH